MPAVKPYKASNKAKSTLILTAWAAVLLLFMGLSSARAQTNPQNQQQIDPSTQALLDVLLDEKNENSQRIKMAQALIQTPKAYPALIEILSRTNHFSTKIIICRVLADGPGRIQPIDREEKFSPEFIDALFQALLSDNSELSQTAASALARCHNGVPQKLADITLDQNQSPPHRLAAIAALELIYGKKPLETLSRVFNQEENPVLKLRAAQALAHLLYLTPPTDLEFFQPPEMDVILKNDENTILLWQLEMKKQELINSRSEISGLRTQADYWLNKYLESITVEFNSRTNPNELLEFITLKLVNQSEDALRVWAVQNICTWRQSPAPLSPEITQALILLLKPFIVDPNPLVRQHTATALGLLDEKGQNTAADLLAQLKTESDPRVQAEILITLAIFPHTPVADQALVLLQSSDNRVVAQAARTLGKICIVNNPPLPEQTINAITQTLPLVYQHHSESAAVKQNLIFAMKNIASLAPYRPVAQEQFNTILVQALRENAPSIRVEAVDALTELHQNAVLPLILDLLNDPDSAVRQDVIRTIGKYPQTEMLEPLHQRLTQESDPDVAGALRSVFETILNNTPMQTCYDWALKLQNSAHREEIALFEGIVEILHQKINRARAANQEFPDEFEILVLLHRIDRARRDARHAQAANDYFALLNFDTIDPVQKNDYRLEIISLVLDNNLLNLYNRTRTEALQPLLPEPNAIPALQTIESAYQQQLENDQLLRAAGIIAYLILPLQDQLPQPEIKTTWDSHRRDIALRLIAAEQQRLNTDTPQHTPEAIDLLLRLDNRLQDFPAADTSVQKKLAWLQNAEKLIRGSKSTPHNT